MIYDLLLKASAPLELCEDPDQGVCVAGLQRIEVASPGEIMSLLEEGNRRRKTDSTDANATSSRSHAVGGRTMHLPGGGREGAAVE